VVFTLKPAPPGMRVHTGGNLEEALKEANVL